MWRSGYCTAINAFQIKKGLGDKVAIQSQFIDMFPSPNLALVKPAKYNYTMNINYISVEFKGILYIIVYNMWGLTHSGNCAKYIYIYIYICAVIRSETWMISLLSKTIFLS